jgi:hypothetical protein
LPLPSLYAVDNIGIDTVYLEYSINNGAVVRQGSLKSNTEEFAYNQGFKFLQGQLKAGDILGESQYYVVEKVAGEKVQLKTPTGSVVVDISTSEFTVEVSQDVGFSTSDKATLSYTDSSSGCTVTLSPVGADYCFYQYGDKYCKTTDSILLPDEEGLFVVYYNLGTLAYVKNPTNAQVEVLIKNNYRNL